MSRIGCYISIPRNGNDVMMKGLQISGLRDLDNSSDEVVYENHQRGAILKDRYNLEDLYLFTFVINPYSRCISWYNYHYKLGIKPYVDYTFDEWIKAGLPHHWTKQNMSEYSKDLTPILQYTFTKGCSPNFIGHIENFKNDIKEVLANLNRSSLKKYNEADFNIHSSNEIEGYYRNYYTAETADIVYNTLKDDFLHFNYNKIEFNVNEDVTAIPLTIHRTTKMKKSGEKTVCLNMIVKNESKIILRCLESVYQWIDYYVISDTGSTDNTQTIIKEFFDKHGIKGEIHQNEWVNFGHNRNIALQLARNKCDYLLFSDADMILKVSDKNWKKKLTADYYNVLQKTTTLKYYNVRLAKNELQAKYESPTHEYFACLKQNAVSVNTEMIYYNDQGDGSNRTDKFIRDIKLLKDGLVKSPRNGRYMFYIARSYSDMGEYEEAIKWYKKRIEVGGWVEEVYYSMYSICDLCFNLGKIPEAFRYGYQAHLYHPKRLESLYKIVLHCRVHGRYHLAYTLAKYALSKPYPDGDLLFVDYNVHKYMFQYELSIVCNYLKGKDAEGIGHCDLLIHDRKLGVAPHIKNSAHSNLYFYGKPLGNKIELTKLVVSNKVADENPLCNPSLYYSKNLNKFLMNVREVDYTFNPSKNSYVYLQGDKTDTHNHFALLDTIPTGDVTNTVVAKPDFIKTYPSHLIGYDDMRWFEFKGEIWGISNSMITKENQKTQELVLHRLDNKTHQVNKLLRLTGYKDNECQKNWMPLVKDKELYLVYSLDPVVVLKPDLETGVCTVVHNKPSKNDYTRIRGGSCFVPYKGNYVAAVHEVIFRDHRRFYFTRFVQLDRKFNIFSVSKPIWFKTKSVEFAAGLAIHDKKVYVTFGLDDSEAYMATLTMQQFDNLIN